MSKTLSLKIKNNIPPKKSTKKKIEDSMLDSVKIPTYKRMDQREHLLKKTGMYIPSLKTTETERWTWNAETQNITLETIQFNPGLFHIVTEIVDNAQDNFKKSLDEGIKQTYIRIIASPKQISVENDGLWIPLLYDETEQMYNPQLIFGNLLAGSNLEDDANNTVGGTYGIGAKATNILSTLFEIECADPREKKLYQQTWTKNMGEVSEPIIKPYRKKTGHTRITFSPDFERFGVECFSQDMLDAIHKRAIDAAGVTGIKVTYIQFESEKARKKWEADPTNEKNIPSTFVYHTKKLTDYVKYYSGLGDSIDFSTSDSEVVFIENRENNSHFQFLSWVNGIYTPMGGIHVETWLNVILDPVIEKLNKSIGVVSQKTSSKKKSASKSQSARSITTSQKFDRKIKRYYMLFVKYTSTDKEYAGQAKERYTGSKPKTAGEMTPAKVGKILKWEITNKLVDEMLGRTLAASDGKIKKGRITDIPNFDDANDVTKKNRSDLRLYVCEGLSAKNLITKAIKHVTGGRDKIGILPLRGKPLNPRDKAAAQVANNKEICALKRVLGLANGVKYDNDENFSKLRYGGIVILTDADDDGKHICGLILNFFGYYFPELLERRFVEAMPTPIVKLWKSKKNTKTFFSQAVFDAEMEKLEESMLGKIEKKYYKGLGAINDSEVKEMWDKKKVIFTYDKKKDKEGLILAFDEAHADDRKTWLADYDPNSHINIDGPNYESIVPVGEFIRNDMIHFSIADNVRSIPSMVDGLKESQRKILYAAILGKVNKSQKVEIFSGYVSQHTDYKHGANNIHSTVIGMAQKFMGANNIPWFKDDGGFGSRAQGGKDAASPRYISTYLLPLTRFIYRPEDDDILTYGNFEGKQKEPEFYIPILPMCLINGVKGIGTAWSTSIPNFNPDNLVEWIRAWLKLRRKNKDIESDTLLIPQMESPAPWYRRFKGTIEKADDKGSKYITSGIVEEVDDNIYDILELPVACWTDDYKAKIPTFTFLQDWKDNTDDLNTHFRLILKKGNRTAINLKSLKLTSSLALTNMVMFDETNHIHKYTNVEEILASFCENRYRYYNIRKEYILNDRRTRLKYRKNERRFILEVQQKTIIVDTKRPKEEIIQQLEERKYDMKEDDKGKRNFEYLLSKRIDSFSKNSFDRLTKEIQTLEEFIKELENTSLAQLWNRELDEFVNAYQSWLKSIENEEEVENSKKKSSSRKTSVKRAKKTANVAEEVKRSKSKKQSKTQSVKITITDESDDE